VYSRNRSIVDGMDAWLDELEELAELHANGWLSDEEFQAEKVRILNRPKEESAPPQTSGPASTPVPIGEPTANEEHLDGTSDHHDQEPIRQPLNFSDEASCELCGRSPAAELVLRQITGYVLAMSWQQHNPVLCGECGQEVARAVQRQTLTKGWWSVRSAAMNPFVAASNSKNRRKHNKLLGRG